VQELTFTYSTPSAEEILAFAREKQVSRVLSVSIYVQPSGTEMHRFGPVQELGGVLVSPACGNPPLTSGAAA